MMKVEQNTPSFLILVSLLLYLMVFPSCISFVALNSFKNAAYDQGKCEQAKFHHCTFFNIETKTVYSELKRWVVAFLT